MSAEMIVGMIIGIIVGLVSIAFYFFKADKEGAL